MAVAIPVIAAFTTVAGAGWSVATAVSTVTGFLSVAGGVLAGVGALTGKKDLVKIGGFMTLASGIGNAINAAGSAASSGAEAASSAWDAAGSAAGSDAAQLGKYGLETAAGAGNEAAQLASTAAEAGGQMQGAAAMANNPGLIDQAQLAAKAQPAAAPSTALASQVQAVDPVTAAGASMDTPTLNSILQSTWDKTKALGSGVGQFVKDNKELVQLGGGILQSMYGPEAEQFDYIKKMRDQRLRNLNSPVQMGYTPAGG